MAAKVVIKIQGLDELRANFRRHPEITKKWINKGIQASIFEIHKNADDSGDSKEFQFKTPRAKRTGQLALSFAEGMAFSDLYGEIGPTVYYAPYVYYGTSRGIVPNPYMDRIAKKSEPNINKFFEQALEGIAEELAKQ